MKTRCVIARRRLLAATAAGAFLPTPTILAQGKAAGIAMVIGNSKYEWESSLPNVKRDVADVARRFEALGLRTEFLEDADRETLRKAAERFKTNARNANFAAFYFAGHGASWDKTGYIVPTDADLGNPEATRNLLQVGHIRDSMRHTKHSLLVFDACRNNPADGWRQKVEEQRFSNADQTQAMAERLPNMLMMFSTAPGHVALDGPAGQNSPFAAAFLRQLGGAATDMQALAGRVRRDLLAASRGEQVVFEVNTYAAPFNVTGPAASTLPASGAAPGTIVELKNAYAYAQQNGIPLPPGLIALRSGGREDWKAGAFAYEAKSGDLIYPEMIVVVSTEGKSAASVVMAGHSRFPTWRVATAKVSGDRLDLLPRDGSARYTFDWSTADSGSVGMIWESARNARPYATRFKRLDG